MMATIDKSYKEKIGTKIAELRIEKNLGVRELALIADIEHHQLINIEKGRVDMRISTLLKIAMGLAVPVKDLLSF